MNTSWYEQELVKEFKTVIAHSFPQVEELLKHCHVKLIGERCDFVRSDFNSQLQS